MSGGLSEVRSGGISVQGILVVDYLDAPHGVCGDDAVGIHVDAVGVAREQLVMTDLHVVGIGGVIDGEVWRRVADNHG